MLKRTITGIIMLSVILPLIFIVNNVTDVLFTILTMFLSFVGTYEFVNGSYIKNKDTKNTLKVYRFIVPIFSSIVSFLILNMTYNLYDLSNFVFFICSLLLIIIVLSICIMFTKDSDANDILTCIYAILYAGVLLSVAFSLRFLVPKNINDNFNLNGTKCFMFVYTIVVMTDVFAYLCGRKFGKHKLSSISPNKTIEGSIGGIIFGVLIGVLDLFIFKIVNNVNALIIIITILLSLVLSIFVELGDLLESKIKRSFNIKDFGKILPGHGGILDRFDSMIVTGSIFYIVIIFIDLLIL